MKNLKEKEVEQCMIEYFGNIFLGVDTVIKDGTKYSMLYARNSDGINIGYITILFKKHEGIKYFKIDFEYYGKDFYRSDKYLRLTTENLNSEFVIINTLLNNQSDNISNNIGKFIIK